MSSERDPLLSSDDESGETRTRSSSARKSSRKSGLALFQIMIVALIQMAEPLTATVIFPFITQFIRETGVTGNDEKKTGYYAGYVESVFFITESLTTFAWARWSDRIGRKPVLVIGMIILTLATGSFGLTNNYGLIMVIRGIQGVCNGNIGVTKAVMAELSDRADVTRIFSFIPLIWTGGVTIGPLVGGMLSRPADRWPRTFGRLAVFRTHPYFLPCGTIALFTAFVAVITWIGLKETHPGKVDEKRTGNLSGSSSRETLIAEVQEPPLHTKPHTIALKELVTVNVAITVFSGFMLAFLSQSISVILPLFYATSIRNGGLGLSETLIGSIMGTTGLLNGVLQLFIFPPLMKRFGARRIYIYSMGMFTINPLCYMAMTLLVRSAGSVGPVIWALIALQCMVTLFISFAYGSMYIYIIELVPSRGVASMNGLVQTAATIGRAISPSMMSSLYSVTLQTRALGGLMVFVVFLVAVVVGTVATSFIPITEPIDKRGEDDE